MTGNETEALQQSLLANTQSPSLVLINNKTETVSQKAREEIEVSSKENDEHSEKGSIHIGEKLGSATIKANAGIICTFLLCIYLYSLICAMRKACSLKIILIYLLFICQLYQQNIELVLFTNFQMAQFQVLHLLLRGLAQNMKENF